jgi:PIN domain nuclease of toxin-antitoxin system
VADIAAAVADTHAIVFYASGDRRLGPRAAAHFAACEAGGGLLYVPAAVILECSLLARTRKIDLRRSVHAFFDDLFSKVAFQPYDLTAVQVYLADDIHFNDDPFDALICAAALELGLPLMTRDGGIRAWGRLRIVW